MLVFDFAACQINNFPTLDEPHCLTSVDNRFRNIRLSDRWRVQRMLPQQSTALQQKAHVRIIQLHCRFSIYYFRVSDRVFQSHLINRWIIQLYESESMHVIYNESWCDKRKIFESIIKSVTNN